MKHKKDYLKRRWLLFRQSLVQRRFIEWLKLSIVDFLFLFIVVLLLGLFLATGLKYFGGIQTLALKAVPLLTQQANSPTQTEGISQVRGDLVSITKSLLLFSLVYFALFSLVASSWCFVSVVKQLGVKIRLTEWLRFVLLKMMWLFICAAIIVLVLFILDGVVGLVVALALFALLVYLSICIDFTYFFKKGLDIFKTAFKVALRRIHCLGFAFVVCIFVLLAVDLAFILLHPSFTLLPGVVSLLFLLFFISWSRFYLSLEFSEALKNEK